MMRRVEVIGFITNNLFPGPWIALALRARILCDHLKNEVVERLTSHEPSTCSTNELGPSTTPHMRMLPQTWNA